jgi:glycosyltransferase involved in cell wall biosynthesis
MDVLVLPSLTEGFPLSLVEGFAAGCPTVATRVGGVPELAQDGVNALLVPASDPAAIARRTIELLEDPVRSARLARAARETAEAYGVDAAASRVTDLYRFLLLRGAAPPEAGHIPTASSVNRHSR